VAPRGRLRSKRRTKRALDNTEARRGARAVSAVLWSLYNLMEIKDKGLQRAWLCSAQCSVAVANRQSTIAGVHTVIRRPPLYAVCVFCYL
jgi:hypothetical protein